MKSAKMQTSLRRAVVLQLGLLVSMIVVLTWSETSQAEDLAVLKPTAVGVAPGQQLELWLKSEFYKMVDQRKVAFEKMIASEAAVKSWQAERRAFFRKQIGRLPERTPLDAHVVGKLIGNGYSVEKIILETRPGFHLTGNLYLPNTPPPWPAVMVPCGHSHEGKAVGQYQRASILLAKNGMAAMCYDPVGQGERYQMLDLTTERTAFEDAKHVKTPHPNVRFLCTIEHTMMGIGCTLLGANVAQYRIWDGMRVIDYLQSRPDIRADKIGCAGNSGGGTETAYLMALDDRIVAASPGGFLTTYRRLIDGNGPQDGEQNIFAQIAFGMDEADYCIMRAPQPTLLCNGMREHTFDIRGTWELFLEAKRVYSRLRRGEAIDINVPDAPHGFTFQQREAVASWMHRWLLGRDKIIREVESLPDTLTDQELQKYNQGDWTVEQLQCTPKGQVLLLPDERSVFQINAEWAETLRKERAVRWSSLSADDQRRIVRDTIGLDESTIPSKPVLESVGKIERDGYAIHKIVLKIDDQLRLPALGFVPTRPSGSATLYLHGSSMTTDAKIGGAIESLVRQGQIVLAAELRGIGETETGHGKREWSSGRFGPDNLQIFLAYLIGKSYVGMRTVDVMHWTEGMRHWLPTIVNSPAQPTDLSLVGIGEASIAALHAAALRPNDYRSVVLKRMISSWEQLVMTPESFDQSVNIVHGALERYDLPELIELAGRNKLTITESVNSMNQVAASSN